MQDNDEIERLGAEITRLRTLLAERDHQIAKLQMTPMGAVTPVPPNNVPDTQADIEPFRPLPPAFPSMAPQAQWGDALDELQPAPGKPVGFTCRSCGIRVKRRHTDPRLLCDVCRPP